MDASAFPPIDVLWVDLRSQEADNGFTDRLTESCCIHRSTVTASIPQMIQEISPHLICFDYDYPDLPGLTALKETKINYPSLPILMLTEHHSEELAIWALRTRVWDYFVKPVNIREFSDRLDMLSRLTEKTRAQNNHRQNRPVHMPQQSIPVEVELLKPGKRITSTLPAIHFVNENFHEKIPLIDVAHLCNMGPYQFSRAFKREHGLTFREFLIRYRINKAREMLNNPAYSIIDIAYAAGFNDPSHFSRTFRQHAGVTPSAYRARLGIDLNVAIKNVIEI